MAAVLFAVGGGLPATVAHEVSSVSLLAKVDTKARSFEVGAAMEVIPSDDPAVNDQISPEDAARTFAEDYLTIFFDEIETGAEQEIRVESASDEETPAELQRDQVLVTLTGIFPEGAREFLLYIDQSCPMAVIMVVIKDEKPQRRMQVILPGEYSRPVNVEPVAEGDPFAAEGETKEGEERVSSGEPEPAESESQSGSARPSRGAFVSGLAAWTESALLSVALVVAASLASLSFAPVAVRLGALVVGQSIGVSLVSSLSVAPPEWGILVIAGGLGVGAAGALLPRVFSLLRVFAFFVAGLFLGTEWTDSGAFRSLGQAGKEDLPQALIAIEPVGESFRVLLFHFGAELAQLAVAAVVAAVLLFLSRFAWFPTRVVPLLVAVLTGLAVFLFAEKLLF